MINVLFPANVSQHYYHIHYQYVLELFKDLGWNIQFDRGFDVDATAFKCVIDKKTFVFDFSDSPKVRQFGFPTFKFHCEKESKGIIPFPPVSFYDWKKYRFLSRNVGYSAYNKQTISCRQRPYGNAIERRTKAQKILKQSLGSNFVTDIVSQEQYFDEVSSILFALFIPGQHENMLDRAQLQYMGLGCCTISPFIPELLPFGKKLVSNIHYIQCSNDYSDSVDLIRSYQAVPNFCNELGQNAKKLFEETCTPEAIGKWIGEHL